MNCCPQWFHFHTSCANIILTKIPENLICKACKWVSVCKWVRQREDRVREFALHCLFILSATNTEILFQGYKSFGPSTDAIGGIYKCINIDERKKPRTWELKDETLKRTASFWGYTLGVGSKQCGLHFYIVVLYVVDYT